MIHDREMIKAAQSELLTLGSGHIAYLKLLDDAAIESLTVEPAMKQNLRAGKVWGLYSASGEVLALCDSAAAAWSYAADNQLMPVSVH